MERLLREGDREARAMWQGTASRVLSELKETRERDSHLRDHKIHLFDQDVLCSCEERSEGIC
jgi:hypothetical protein